MSLAGNLKTMDLPEILQWISGGRKTGTLHLDWRSVQKRIVFRDGIIYTSWSNDPRESLGQFLMRDRLLTEEQLFKALLRQEQEGRLLGAILVGDGLITEESLRETLQDKVAETIYDLFLWPEGRFEFKDGDLPKDPLVPVDMHVTGVIMEGIRRVDEWQRMRQVFPGMGTTFTLPRDVPQDVTDPVERHLLTLARAGKTLAHIAVELRRSEFEATEIAYSLYNRGLLGVAQVESAPRVEDPAGLIQHLLAAADGRLEEKRYDKALEAYEKVLAVDRLNQNAKKGLIAVIEARNRERALRLVPLDKIPVLTMDFATLTRENFDPHEGFVISRVNGQWDVQSILKLCPMGEEAALLIFARLLERKVISMQ
jgi:tetratricopeptide (TPR) repeat protein